MKIAQYVCPICKCKYSKDGLGQRCNYTTDGDEHCPGVIACVVSERPTPYSQEAERYRGALELIRKWSNGTQRCAEEMQMLAAEALYPARFPTPRYLVDALKENATPAEGNRRFEIIELDNTIYVEGYNYIHGHWDIYAREEFETKGAAESAVRLLR